MALTVDSLVAAGCSREAAAKHYPHIVRAMLAEDINTPLRARYFLAQALHESGCLQFMEEIWGPTSFQKGYEGRKDLGNTQSGDGFRFRGRGPFMLTGRTNYTRFGTVLDRPYASTPELVSKPADGWLVAAQYWSDRKLNALADADQARAITKGINGAATDGDPSHHLRRMAIFAKLPKDCEPDPYRCLEDAERELVLELEAERRSARRHGGWAQLEPSHLENAKQLKAKLRECVAAITRAAEQAPDGWKRNHRKERVQLLNATVGD